MKLRIKCSCCCNNDLIIEDKDFKKIKTQVYRKEGEKYTLPGNYGHEYIAKNNTYQKYIKCPICNGRAIIRTFNK